MLHLKESSAGDGPYEYLCGPRCHVENWMEPWLLVSLNWNWLTRQYHVHRQDVTELLAEKRLRRLLDLVVFNGD